MEELSLYLTYIKESLIDEFYLFVNPIVIGKGMPVFNKLTKNQNFRLMDSRAFDYGINLLLYSLGK